MSILPNVFDLWCDVFINYLTMAVYVTDIMIRVQEVDVDTETIGAIHNMRISPSRTVAELKAAVAAQLDVSAHNVRCVTERNSLRLLDVPSKTLYVEGFQKTNKVHRLFSVSFTSVKCQHTDTLDSLLSYVGQRLNCALFKNRFF